jgi:NADH-quinone oxidoreductase subunit C|tara:strand:+ start:185 stop:808 length:624 start_codon:yes stop_codon:yes gene_type:complete
MYLTDKMQSIGDTKKIIVDRFLGVELINNDKYLEIKTEPVKIFKVIKELKEDTKLLFDQLIDVTAIDYPSREKRFDIIYLLLSLTLNQRILVKTSIDESTVLESITIIHKAANWYERECYDLFGIQFSNHPDLRRIMTDYNFEGHPLRKDFPLTGHTEVHYDDLEKKVVYEPVKLAQEYRNFDYISPWEGIDNKLIGDEKSSEENNS